MKTKLYRYLNIRFYNSLTNQIEPFHSIEEGKVSMYVCGPTVYNYPHLGNMRPVVVFDTLRRFLEHVGYKVKYVSNFTDVDDKIIKAAKNKGISESELTKFYINEFLKTTDELGSRRPTVTPKVTTYIPMIKKYIRNLVRIGAAYYSGGDVYFRVRKIDDYGCLSGISRNDLLVGARIEENSNKESPLDFALWKNTNDGIKWGFKDFRQGRPGWHTECCVMIDTLFKNKEIDIHGGGYDLKFPHHENEIAQTEATHHHKIARFWMHNGFINFGDEKMSKSLGNVVYAKDMIEKYGGAVTRLVILNAHYRQPVNYTDETVNAAVQEVNKMQMAYKQMALILQMERKDFRGGKTLDNYMIPFYEALADDLNTANALARIYDLVKVANQEIRNREQNHRRLLNMFLTLRTMFDVLGLNIEYVKLGDEERALYNEYLAAKQEKDFAKSDEIRQKLIAKGIM